MSEQIAGESGADYIKRLESELVYAEEEAKRACHLRDETMASLEALQNEHDMAREELDFLREQIADLALNITSPSAPVRKSEMARLLNGLLNRDHWQHGTWRDARRAQRTGTAKEADSGRAQPR